MEICIKKQMNCYLADCIKGFYGLKCTESCPNCKYGLCERLSGECHFGCIYKFSGSRCQGIYFHFNSPMTKSQNIFLSRSIIIRNVYSGKIKTINILDLNMPSSP